MSEDLKGLAKRVYTAVNEGDFDTMRDLMADDVVEHEQMPGFEANKEGVIQFFRMMREAFPDLSMTVEDMLAEGDKVCARVTMTGTHRGEFMGMPATGNRVSIPLIDLFRIRDGKLTEHWGVSDMATMMEQLGS